ncbi:cellulase family glycosylhydrolase [Frankia canadensis]|uniref:cellulase family glycosylhydrolase n=1 Tax=Frankia canadensis TaxID=1836972 RepID=UPI0014026DFC|nr:cellulase family glycosylhydrolase [Frankia canadensis]
MLTTVLMAVGLAGSASGADTPFVRSSSGRLVLQGVPFLFTGMNLWNANANLGPPQYCGSPAGLSAAGDEFGPGVRAVRLWFFQRLATTPEGMRDWSAFDATVHAAAAHNLRIIAVLGNQWADCEGYASAADGYRTRDWYRDGYRRNRPPGQPDTYRDWVRAVVERYRDDPTIMMWQLVNEPEDADSLGGSCSPDAAEVLRAFTRDVGRQVKDLDARHLLGMGTTGSGQCGTSGGDYVQLNADPSIDVADYHDYALDVLPGDQWNGLATRAHEMVQLGKPLIIGEMGVVPDQVGGFQQRASLITSKLHADYELGVQGALLWAWRPASAGGSSSAGYDIGPGDPVLDRLAALAP